MAGKAGRLSDKKCRKGKGVEGEEWEGVVFGDFGFSNDYLKRKAEVKDWFEKELGIFCVSSGFQYFGSDGVC